MNNSVSTFVGNHFSSLFSIFFSTLLIVSLFFVMAQVQNQQTYQSSAAVDTQAKLVLFDDILAPQWANWSYGGAVDFQKKDTRFPERRTMISLSLSKDPALFHLHTDSVLETDSLSLIHFLLYSQEDLENTKFIVYDANGVDYQVILQNTTTGLPKKGLWNEYEIPVVSLGIQSDTEFQVLSGLALQVQLSTGSSGTVLLDDLYVTSAKTTQ